MRQIAGPVSQHLHTIGIAEDATANTAADRVGESTRSVRADALVGQQTASGRIGVGGDSAERLIRQIYISRIELRVLELVSTDGDQTRADTLRRDSDRGITNDGRVGHVEVERALEQEDGHLRANTAHFELRDVVDDRGNVHDATSVRSKGHVRRKLAGKVDGRRRRPTLERVEAVQEHGAGDAGHWLLTSVSAAP